jgi:hypothetical protein
MTRMIRINADVMFAADVFDPEWPLVAAGGLITHAQLRKSAPAVDQTIARAPNATDDVEQLDLL